MVRVLQNGCYLCVWTYCEERALELLAFLARLVPVGSDGENGVSMDWPLQGTDCPALANPADKRASCAEIYV